MNISYGLVYSAESVADQSVVTGLHLIDSDAEKNYIMVIPQTLTISEGKVVDDFDIVEIDPNTLTLVSANVPLQSKSVDPDAIGSVVSADQGYVGLSSVTVNAANLSTLSVKSNTKNNQTKTPTAPAIGFSSVTVEKFNGESGSPESEYKNGDEVFIKLPSKYEKSIEKLPEFNGYYKAVVSDTNKTYAHAQIVYKDNSLGPRIPMFDIIGKVDIIPAN